MTARDHGGGLDAAIARFGGRRSDWLDLSTGINPVPYPLPDLSREAWTALPDRAAMERLLAAARRFWNVPHGVAIVAAPGASALIARMPELTVNTEVHIPRPTYNEHAAAFAMYGYSHEDQPDSPVRVLVHPNNPDGQIWPRASVRDQHRELTIIDESFCEVTPALSHVAETVEPGVLVLKSFGKFWGLAGLRLGFAVGLPHTLARSGRGADEPIDLAEVLGPWPVSGPALEIGARALEDTDWAEASRDRLTNDADRLDRFMTCAGAAIAGGTTLFRLYEVDDAAAWQDRLARARIWSRTFPYSKTWLRLGLPPPDRWTQLEAAL